MSQAARQHVLEYLCNEFIEKGEPVDPLENEVIEAAEDKSNIDRNDVELAIKRLDGRYINGPGGINGSLSLHASGIDEYERISGKEVISDSVKADLRDVLAEAERNSPRDAYVSKENLLKETSADTSELEQTAWYLNQKGEIDTRGGFHFHDAKITR